MRGRHLDGARRSGTIVSEHCVNASLESLRHDFKSRLHDGSRGNVGGGSRAGWEEHGHVGTTGVIGSDGSGQQLGRRLSHG